MAEPAKRLYWLNKRTGNVEVFEIIRETRTRWFVGHEYALGGYIVKPKTGKPPRYTTDPEEIARQWLAWARPEERRMSLCLSTLRMGIDMLEEGSVQTWLGGDHFVDAEPFPTLPEGEYEDDYGDDFGED